MPSIWLQIIFCLPLWIAIAAMASAGKAIAAGTAAKRSLWQRWAIVFALTLASSLLWANPRQMLLYSGPFTGKVIDAETGKPVPVALLVFTWTGALGTSSTHNAWTITGADGEYRLNWQGFGNWRIGAWPAADSFYVLAPGYASSQFFLDGKERNPNGDHDAKARSATHTSGQIRLQRLHPDTKFNFATKRSILFGVGSRQDRLIIANRFYNEAYPRLCPENAQPAEWVATDHAFQQLYWLVNLIDPDFYRRATAGDTESKFAVETLDRRVIENNTPLLLDANTAQKLCAQLKLKKRDDH
jgi:hypothetical protein